MKQFDLSFYQGKKVFVTGHTGFKGSWLCKVLANAGAIVTGYSLNPPTSPSLFEIADIAQDVHSVIGDIRDYATLKAAFDAAQPEIVLHLAAQPIVRDSYKNPAYTYETNVMGTVNILECVRNSHCVKSFLNVTTDKVYLNKEWAWGYRENEELDGFDPSKGVIVLGATNRPEVLDKALLRPGRFDRRITVDRPNLAGRLATLQVHTRNIRLAEDVNLEKIAQATAGCVGADLANLVNEAALRAVRKGRRAVNQADLLGSFELVIAGSEKKGTVITQEEKRIIAYHEVGHALVAAKQKNAQPVSKITIVPHTQGALGYTLHLPEEEKFLMSRDDILTEIRTLLAGRSSEEVVCNTMTSGAANDIERATEMARNLVARFGMCDEFDMMALGSVQSQYLDGGYSMTCAQETYAAADRETIKILRQCHEEAKQILRENRELLDKIAAYLLKKETITGQEMMAIIEGRDPETVDNYGATREEDQKLFRPSTPDVIEAPAKHINIVSEPIPMPDFDSQPEDKPEDKPEDRPEEKPQEDPQPEDSQDKE